LFYLTVISVAVWNYNPTVGYYSMSIYPQIGLVGLVGVLAIILWRSGGPALCKWLALAAGVVAPFIHPSEAYVPVAVSCFAYVYEPERPGASWSPLRMFAPISGGLRLGWRQASPCSLLFLVVVQKDGDPFLSMAHNPLSVDAVVKSAYFLFSQGVALELFRPLVVLLLPRAGLATQGAAATAVALAFSIAGVLNIAIARRRTYFALLAPCIIVIIVVSLGRRLIGIDDVVNAVGKYNTHAYLWFSIASFYLLSCLVPKIPVQWREPSAMASVVIAGALFIQYARQDNIFRTEAIRRQKEMDSLVAVFGAYAAKAAPAPMHIPTLDGNFIYPTRVLIWKYNPAHYRPFFQGLDDRLTLLRNDAMDRWGREGTQLVPSLRAATDPGFIRALETDQDLQSLYLVGVELEQHGQFGVLYDGGRCLGDVAAGRVGSRAGPYSVDECHCRLEQAQHR
jgi:hypothetical protein